MSSARLQRINTLMQHYVDEQKIAGIITMIARKGKVVHFEQFGQMDKEGNKPMQREAIFRIASLTKPIVSVAVMILFEEGHFQLDDPVSKARRSGKSIADVRIRQLFRQWYHNR